MVIPAVEIDIVARRTVIFNRARTPTHVPDAGTRIVSTDDDRGGFHGDRCERRAKLPAV